MVFPRASLYPLRRSSAAMSFGEMASPTPTDSGAAKNPRVVGKRPGVQLFVDHSRVPGVEKREDAQHHDHQQGAAHDHDAPGGRQKESRQGRIGRDAKAHPPFLRGFSHQS